MEKSIENMDFVESVKKHFSIKDVDANMYSPLVLAYIGDGVYEIIVRTVLVSRANMPVNKLHRASSNLVKASAQAYIYEAIGEELSEEEHNIMRRGRNAKSYTTAKNATVSDYRKATGLEALVGYLYLLGRYDRLNYLVKIGLDKLLDSEEH